ncbi:TPM domain-containing protein, partial [Curtobacterium sp. B18]|uniref:TPM domain-containing protein n=1 Tax=Curtobacterium sp. B18 TaxID=95614 RepID=UPI0004CE36DA
MAAALLAGFLVLAPAATAHATAPVDLDGAYVLDEADVLSSSQQSQVEDAVQKLYADTKTQLYVVFVPEFTDPSDHTAWGTATLSANQIDSDGILLSVAVDERNYDVQQTNETSISESDVKSAVDDDLVPGAETERLVGRGLAFANG